MCILGVTELPVVDERGPLPARGQGGNYGHSDAIAQGPAAAISEGHTMYGLIGRMPAQAGKRCALTEVLVEGVAGMPGCLSYVVANDPADANVI